MNPPVAQVVGRFSSIASLSDQVRSQVSLRGKSVVSPSLCDCVMDKRSGSSR